MWSAVRGTSLLVSLARRNKTLARSNKKSSKNRTNISTSTTRSLIMKLLAIIDIWVLLDLGWGGGRAETLWPKKKKWHEIKVGQLEKMRTDL